MDEWMHGRTKRDNGERQATRDKRKREHSQVRAQQRRVLCCTPPCARGKHTQKGLYGQTERGRGGAETETPRRKRETLSGVEMERELAHVGEERRGGDVG